MSEYVAIFCGPISRRLATQLRVAKVPAVTDLWQGSVEEVDGPQGRTYMLSDEETRRGLRGEDPQAVLAWCRDHGVPYYAHSDGDDSGPGEIRQWTPQMDHEFCITADGGEDPTFSLRQWVSARERCLEAGGRPEDAEPARLLALVKAVDEHFGIGLVPLDSMNHPSIAAWHGEEPKGPELGL